MKTHLNEMIFYGYHGVYQEERNLGQRFIVNVTVITNPELDSHIKNLEDTVDYTKIYSEIEAIMETQQFYQWDWVCFANGKMDIWTKVTGIFSNFSLFLFIEVVLYV